jgi:oligoendopeptidase F
MYIPMDEAPLGSQSKKYSLYVAFNHERGSSFRCWAHPNNGPLKVSDLNAIMERLHKEFRNAIIVYHFIMEQDEQYASDIAY